MKSRVILSLDYLSSNFSPIPLPLSLAAFTWLTNVLPYPREGVLHFHMDIGRAEGINLNKGFLPELNMLEDRHKEPPASIASCTESRQLEVASS